GMRRRDSGENRGPVYARQRPTRGTLPERDRLLQLVVGQLAEGEEQRHSAWQFVEGTHLAPLRQGQEVGHELLVFLDVVDARDADGHTVVAVGLDQLLATEIPDTELDLVERGIRQLGQDPQAQAGFSQRITPRVVERRQDHHAQTPLTRWL